MIILQTCFRDLENLESGCFAVSGPRKISSFLFKNRRRLRTYDMVVEANDDDDEDEDDDDEYERDDEDYKSANPSSASDFNTSGEIV